MYVSPAPTSVDAMSADVSPLSCYLVEWYQPELTDELLDEAAARLGECVAAMCADGSPVQLRMTFAVPSDEVIFAILAASSAKVVAETCDRAGMPAQRLTVAVDAGIVAAKP
jgi:Protein of unknown function (DUF4242)